METVIVAFEHDRTAQRVKEILEADGAVACLVCRTADQVRRSICKLPVPAVVCGYKLEDQTAELLASVRMLLQVGRRLEWAARPQRSQEELALIDRAKALLMDRNGMTEEQAHRYLQKKSMDSGVKLIQTAQQVLDSAQLG